MIIKGGRIIDPLSKTDEVLDIRGNNSWNRKKYWWEKIS